MINRDKLEEVDKLLSTGVKLNLTMLGDIFGTELWQLIVMLLVDGRTASEQLIAELQVRSKN